MTKKELAQYLDATNLSNTANVEDIENLCTQAIKYGFKSVCVHPHYVELAKELLINTPVLVCTVIGFPLGMNTLYTKVYETQNAIDDGADEIDMVINVAELKNKNLDYCLEEINSVKLACGGKTLKVIVETSQLTLDEKVFAAKLIGSSNADYIKTSTGFVGTGAQLEDIELWKPILKPLNKYIKASGGIRDLASCLKFINIGVDRIGTSKAVEIIEDYQE